MIDRKNNYVCTVCSETFTRRSSAKRHSNIIHASTAPFVRFTDYIIGRLEGLYQPGDPQLYRHQKKNRGGVKNSFPSGRCESDISVDKFPASRFTTLADMTNKRASCGTDVTTQHSKSSLGSENDSITPGRSGEPRLNDAPRRNGINGTEGTEKDQKYTSSISDSQSLDKTLKFREYAELIERNAPKEEVRMMLYVATWWHIMGKDHLLEMDKWLPRLRHVDRVRHGVS